MSKLIASALVIGIIGGLALLIYMTGCATLAVETDYGTFSYSAKGLKK